MKKLLVLFVLVNVMMVNPILSQETLRMSFTGRIGDGYYQRMDNVEIRNVTRDWIEEIIYPDTTLLISSTVNVGEYIESKSIGVKPNPFYGETSVSFGVEEPSRVVVTSYRMSGEICSRYESILNTGNYYIKVCLEKPQIYILSLQIGESLRVVKLCNIGNCFHDYIEIFGDNGGCRNVLGRGQVNRPFEYGDVMEYVGYATINGSSVSSEIITQPQLFSEDISLHFSAYLPTVQTNDVEEIQQTMATCGGEVVSDGWSFVTNRGVCWSTQPNPTIADSHTDNQSGLGHFTSSITGLEPNTIYYVRAFATNSIGTAYGNQKEFVTASPPNVPEGAICGLFSVSGDCQVFFSKGNLQYTKSTQTWSFMEHQYDRVEVNHQNVGEDYSNQDVVSLFGWGTSGFHNVYDNFNWFYQPYTTARGPVPNPECNCTGYGPSTNMSSPDLTGMSDEYDWGVHNAISNGGGEVGLWRSLTIDEWSYLFNIRPASTIHGTANARFAKATVNGVPGVILFPDVFSIPEYLPNPLGINYSGAGFNLNSYSIEGWTAMESLGCVFLPIAYYRLDININVAQNDLVQSYYWSTTHADCYDAFPVGFGTYGIYLEDGERRYVGCSVRLVQPAGQKAN